MKDIVYLIEQVIRSKLAGDRVIHILHWFESLFNLHYERLSFSDVGSAADRYNFINPTLRPVFRPFISTRGEGPERFHRGGRTQGPKIRLRCLR